MHVIKLSIARAAWLLVFGLAVGCSGDPAESGGAQGQDAAATGDDIIFGIDSAVGGGDAGSADQDASSDSGAAGGDAATNAETAGTPDTSTGDCPGGPDCACTSPDECDTGICLDFADSKRCARKCVNTCADGLGCVPFSIGGDSINVCAPLREWLCDPCTQSSSCQSVGLAKAVCVDYGLQAGGFCGTPCADNDACPVGFACQQVSSIEGGAAKQCVRVGTGADLGTCECSASATKKKLATDCSVVATDDKGNVLSKCPGKRTCEDSGLTVCIGPKPESEACDGIDNDCDGKTDEQACDDGNQCTADACKAAEKTCVNAKYDGPCDADASACTEGDACTGGVCLPGKTKICDDGKPCTLDSCDKVTGLCSQVPDDGKACDADGNPCTEGDSCTLGECVAGKAKPCDSGKPCVSAECDPVKAGCVFKNKADGAACDDNSPCTAGDACDAAGACSGVGQTCDDGNACTLDSCDETKGCTAVVDANKSMPCYDGPKGTDGIGACKQGVRQCMADGSLGACQAQVVPSQSEACDGADDDCDGKTDEGCGTGGIVLRVSNGGIDGAEGKFGMRAMVGSVRAGAPAAAGGDKYTAHWGIYAWLKRVTGK